MTEINEETASSRRLGLIRLGIGLAQGLVLFGLNQAWKAKAWPATEPALQAALALVAVLVPVMLLGGIGSLRRRTLIVWTCVAVALVAIFGAHDVLHQTASATGGFVRANPQTVAAAAGLLFIAHHLIVPPDRAGRLVAPYAAYFDAAWKDAVQLALSAAFVGALWIVLMLGAELFHVIKIEAFREVIRKPWFVFPVTGVAFAAAVHLTDVRVALTVGVRTLGLTLLSWIMPVMAGIAAAFLCALPFTGLQPLWDTRSAAGLLLGAASVLILLINAAYQGGDAERPAPLVVRYMARVAGVVTVPLAGIAIYALALRVGQYGWTPQRIFAGAVALAAACYAVGYLVAAVRPGRWMAGIERVNVAGSVLLMALIVALFTPIADPKRVSVADQVARLEAGKVAADKFDYSFLRYRAGRYGEEALKRLAALKTGPNAAVIARAANDVAKNDDSPEGDGDTRGFVRLTPSPKSAPRIGQVYPAGATLPEGFDLKGWEPGASLFCTNACEAYVIDLDGDGASEVIVRSTNGSVIVVGRGPDKKWVTVGTLARLDCATRDALRQGKFERTAPRWKDLIIGGARLTFSASLGQATEGCKD